jgi:hypothetical protein
MVPADQLCTCGAAIATNVDRDGKSIVFVKKASPLTGDSDNTVQMVDVVTGASHGPTGVHIEIFFTNIYFQV